MIALPTKDAPARILEGDCTTLLRALPDACVDAVITDPPYPCIQRDYGWMTEVEWRAMMEVIVPECRRVLKPTGSAVFILQPNSERVGRMRPWLWEFMARWTREWGMVQDVWWWNIAAVPVIHCQRRHGLMRPSLKACIWLGAPDCYKNQDEILWTPSGSQDAVDREDRALRYYPSGLSMRAGPCAMVADERGGVTPFNVIPLSGASGIDSAGAHGHGAGTPEKLCAWWIRYICPLEGVVLDPFVGSGTVALAALRLHRRAVGIERHPTHYETAARRVARLLDRQRKGLAYKGAPVRAVARDFGLWENHNGK